MQRRHPGGVAEVVGEDAPGERRARCRLDGPDGRAHGAGQLLAEEGEGQSAEVGPAAGQPTRGPAAARRPWPAAAVASSPIIVWCISTWLSTLPSAYRVSGSARRPHGLADGDPERARAVGVGGQHGPPGAVSSLGERWTRPRRPPSSPGGRVSGRSWPRTCQISHWRPKRAQAKARAVPHWPAPVSVARRFTPALACRTPAARPCSACGIRPGKPLVLVVDAGRRAEGPLEPVRPERGVGRHWR